MRGALLGVGEPPGDLHLGDLDVPVAVLVPHEAVDRVGDVVEPVVGEALRRRGPSTRCSSPTIQRSALEQACIAFGAVLPSQFISTNLLAFQSLLQKLR